MILNKASIQRRIQASLLLILCISICTMLSGCSNKQPKSEGTPPSTETSPPAEKPNTNNTNNTTEQPNSNSQTESTVSGTEGIPSGVTIKKVLKDVEVKNNYRKKVELLSDGGKRVTITDANQKIVTQHIEYDGVIESVDGKKVTVQVEKGGKQTLTIPSHIVIGDEGNLGLNKGVEIEWEVDSQGQIQDVELED
ncbi:hypothetical protein [Paenibacillus glacialis]|uniref:Lipoprotein n=1 Tax=Paenibacillus glacialis TaxID=494026 RepID=A0A168HQ19_9BACL|nr:hypothetical protein [Paenibacillus glacialis]OAB38412.1 hypothetical protein PGLA_20180 [Paenibacillus glacialis]